MNTNALTPKQTLQVLQTTERRILSGEIEITPDLVFQLLEMNQKTYHLSDPEGNNMRFFANENGNLHIKLGGDTDKGEWNLISLTRLRHASKKRDNATIDTTREQRRIFYKLLTCVIDTLEPLASDISNAGFDTSAENMLKQLTLKHYAL